MIRAEPISDTEAYDKNKSRGIMDLAPRQGNLYAFDPRLLRIEPGFNARLVDFDPNDDEDLKLARSIAEVGVKTPLVVYMREGEPTVTDGHRRLAATLYAMDVLGAPIKSIPVRTEPKQASATDRAYTVLLSNESKLLAPIERANHYAKLMGYGETEAEIAAKIGRSRQHVVDMLSLRAGPQAVVEMVKAGEVSATLATQTIKASKGDDAAATETLTEGVKVAKAAGKTKATRKHLKPKPPKVEVLSVPKDHPTYKAGWEDGKSEGRAAAARDAVEIAKRFLTTRDADGEAGEIWAVRQVVDALEAEVSR